MFLKKLLISTRSSEIREITFTKGINLIVDETEDGSKTSSGNNVGKTTVLKLIDFCLGGDGKNIYSDSEFSKKSNSDVLKYLVENEVLITLILKSDLETAKSEEITLKKNFLKGEGKVQEINGEPYSDKDYAKTLKQLIFHSQKDKPTFRQIISKNIRDEKNKLINTVKVLHSTATQDVYESLYLFWLGIEVPSSDKKQKLLAEEKNEIRLQERLKADSNLSQVEQSLIVIDNKIKELTKRKDNLNLNNSYEQEIADLNKVKATLNHLATQLSRLKLRRELIIESQQELEGEVSKIDTESIKKLYEEAHAFIPQMQKTFEETLMFHNQMIAEKIKFITAELPDLEAKIIALQDKISKALSKEKSLTEKLAKTDAFNEIQAVITQLTDTSEKKGRLEELRKLWMDSNSKLGNIKQEINSINRVISEQDGLIQERITIFNKYFSDISLRLYGEEFVLSSDKNQKGYELNISNLSGNLGTGKKKGQIAAFDLAYIQFADALNIKCLHFILHDQIENVHDNQISNLLTEIVSSINCQYILPVLRDKLPNDVDTDRLKILSLSETDRLFRF